MSSDVKHEAVNDRRLILYGPVGTSFDVPRLGRITATDIMNAVCRHFKIHRNVIIGPARPRRIARPRQLAMALTRELTELSLPDIGQRYGGRDHTTVLYAVKRVAELRQSSPILAGHYQTLKEQLTFQPANDAEDHK